MHPHMCTHANSCADPTDRFPSIPLQPQHDVQTQALALLSVEQMRNNPGTANVATQRTVYQTTVGNWGPGGHIIKIP